jgi:glyoxylase-like metal-dependent hydrolase (beta-lactamase superfamily II)
MKIGNYTISAVETGTFALDGGAMFGVVPKNLWQKSCPADEQNRIDLALRALLLQGHNHTILVDCGIGTKFDPKWSEIYKIRLEQDNLHKALNRHNLTTNDITDVILSHLHFDHAGGLTHYHNGTLQLTFPNARHYVQREQWEWALNPSQKDRASFLKENLLPIESSGRLHLLEDENIPLPEIELKRMYGHTPAMQLVQIDGQDRSLLYCADLIPTRSHIPIPWVMAYDNHPMKTMQEKNDILKDAVKHNRLLFFEHDPDFPAGYVVYDERKGFLAGTSFSKADFNTL